MRGASQPQRILLYAGGRHGIGHSICGARLAVQLLDQHRNLTVSLLVPTGKNLITPHPRMAVFRLRAVRDYIYDIHRMVYDTGSSGAARSYREATVSETAEAADEIPTIANRFRRRRLLAGVRLPRTSYSNYLATSGRDWRSLYGGAA